MQIASNGLTRIRSSCTDSFLIECLDRSKLDSDSHKTSLPVNDAFPGLLVLNFSNSRGPLPKSSRLISSDVNYVGLPYDTIMTGLVDVLPDLI